MSAMFVLGVWDSLTVVTAVPATTNDIRITTIIACYLPAYRPVTVLMLTVRAVPGPPASLVSLHMISFDDTAE